MQPKRLFIVDAMAMAFRSFYAFGARPLSTVAGLPTTALFGSAIFMQKLIAEQKPDYLVIASDTRAPTFRHLLFDAYKANRNAMPEDLAAQLPHFKRLLEAFGAKFLAQAGLEADDIIGTLARRFASDDLHVYIVSGDKDFMQLVDQRTFLFQPKKGDEALLINEGGVLEKFGVRPDQVIDCMAIIGDTSDNIPGVHGIGEKGAAKLISDYGSLDQIYANLEQIANKKHRTCLEQHRTTAYLSRQLVTIKTDAELGVELDELRCDLSTSLANQELLDFYREFEFRNLATKVEQTLGGGSSLFMQGGTARQLELLPDEPKAPLLRIAAETPDYILVNTKERLAALTAALKAASEFAFDTETTGLDVVSDKPIGLSFAVREKGAYYLPIVARHLEGVSPEEALAAVRPFLEGRDQFKIGHNIKFDLQMLANVGITTTGPFVDTMISDWLLDPGGRQHGLDPCCLKHLNYEKIATATLIGEKAQYSMLDAPLEDLARYACEDADLTLRLAHHLLPMIEAKGLTKVLRDIEMPLVPILAAMEQTGVFIDAKVLRELSTKLSDIAGRLEKEIYGLAGTEFNINSTRQLADILFTQLKVHEQLGIKYLKKTQSGWSTDESVLTRLAAHPLPRAILEYRLVAKLKGTYVDALPQLVHEKTGRIHASFHQTGTATGRLSSSEPNLQNIPIRSELGQEIRRAFRAQNADHLIISADYSQVELRLLAHLADEKALTEAFANGTDIHSLTASKVFGIPPEQVDQTMRSRAKAINFGIIYGMGARRLSAETGVTLAEATAFIDKYFAGYPGINRYIEKAVADAQKTGEARTLTGRLRPVEGLGAGSRGRNVASAENIAVNSPIQGSAADLIKLAMIRIDRELKRAKLQTKLLMQVHDELVFECPIAERVEVERLVTVCMQEAMTLTVPLQVDVGHGESWLEAH